MKSSKFFPKTFILSLGGSLIFPEGIDTKFLKQFTVLIKKQIKFGHRFVIITGGGKICRRYQAALQRVGQPKAVDLDWMGIYLTRTNAELLRLIFDKLAHSDIVIDPNLAPKTSKKIIIAGGWMPGRSTDDDAVRLAKVYGAKILINLSNVDYVYTKDPRKFPHAKKIEEMSWKDFRKLIGREWKPGANVIFDPVAAKFAQQHKQKVIIANGKNLQNLQAILSQKSYIGTTIS